MRKVQFENNNLYHIYNRGTEKRNIFLDNADYYRFIHYLYQLNNASAVLNIARKIDGGPTSINRETRDLLVEIVAFCLMPNHFHLVLKQVKDNGTSKFMQKLCTGYSMYFNKKYKRSGTLFQGKFRSILIESDEYLAHLSRYIHLNSVELIEPDWKREGVKDWGKINEFLGNYRWSSYLDYIGIKNFPSIINKETVASFFQNEQSYKNFINQWLADDLEPIKQAILE